MATLLGAPQQRYPLRDAPPPDDPLGWVTDVRFRGETVGSKKPFTHRASRLRLHTARAAAPVQPRLFMMLMAEIDVAAGERDNGESQFARLDDAIARLQSELGAAAADVLLSTLSTRPISSGEPYPDEPKVEPILTRGDDRRWKFRYWETILQLAGVDPPDEAVGVALRRFDKVLNSRAVRMEVSLGKSELVLLDNDRVAHGRKSFPAWKMDAAGNRRPSRRLLYNVHVFSDLT